MAVIGSHGVSKDVGRRQFFGVDILTTVDAGLEDEGVIGREGATDEEAFLQIALGALLKVLCAQTLVAEFVGVVDLLLLDRGWETFGSKGPSTHAGCTASSHR